MSSPLSLRLVLGLVWFALLLQESGASGAGADADDSLDLDADDEQEEIPGPQSADGSPSADGPPSADGRMGEQFSFGDNDVDKDMPPQEKNTRMRACYVHTIGFAGRNAENLKMMQEAMQKEGHAHPEQMFNQMLLAWIMSCYLQIDEAGVQAGINHRQLLPEQEAEMYTFALDDEHHTQKVGQATREQWVLLEEVVADINQKAPPRNQQRPGIPAGAEMSQLSLLYILVVFGVIFALGALAVQRLSNAAQPTQASSGKREKAERKLGKKRQ